MPSMTCLRCHTVASPLRVARGSYAVFVVLALLGLAAAAYVLHDRFAEPEPVEALTNELTGAPRPTPLGLGELLLVGLVALAPAFGYTLWRSAGRYPVCARCRSRDVVPADSPRALALRDRA